MDLLRAWVKDLPENDEELVAEVRRSPQISGSFPMWSWVPFLRVSPVTSHGHHSCHISSHVFSLQVWQFDMILTYSRIMECTLYSMKYSTTCNGGPQLPISFLHSCLWSWLVQPAQGNSSNINRQSRNLRWSIAETWHVALANNIKRIEFCQTCRDRKIRLVWIRQYDNAQPRRFLAEVLLRILWMMKSQQRLKP